MNILVTGARGFMGKNLVATLEAIRDGKDKSHGLTQELTILPYDLDTDPALLDGYCRQADFVCHLAGVNRPRDAAEFMEGNFGFTSTLLSFLRKHHNRAPVLIASSIQAALDNPYGQSKKAGEDLLFAYGRQTGAPVYVYRLPNAFGKWSRPNYNSAIATFCHNIARGLPITVSDRANILNLVYIDDIAVEIMRAMQRKPNKTGEFCEVQPVHRASLGQIVDWISSFPESRTSLQVPQLDHPLVKKLYSTYLSFLPEDAFAYPLTSHADERGSFTEVLRTPDRGQVSVNISKPGITKGNHWHHTKNEKFLVVKGRGVIRFRKIGGREVIEYFVNGDELKVVDIPTGYTHNIENLGEEDMVTLMWANEPFDPQKPDTYFEKVDCVS
ncbi:MAG TPA: capsular polysaccharide biosynthesis protein CapF [Clostridia bacterium]|nr:capsular polysaccharide biosynthesis protein CapF [Clostridia bacterium]